MVIWAGMFRIWFTKGDTSIAGRVREVTPMKRNRGSRNRVQTLRRVIADETFLECELEWLWVLEEEHILVRCEAVAPFTVL